MNTPLSPPETLLSPPETLPDVFRIVVTGDVVVDHHIYEGKRTTAAAYNRRGFRVKREHGGAAGLFKLLEVVVEGGKEAAIDSRKKVQDAAQEEVKKAQARVLEAEPKQGDDLATAREALAEAEKRLAEITPRQEENCTVEFPLSQLPELDSLPLGHHALATWKPFAKDRSEGDKGAKVWRASRLLGYGDGDGRNSGVGVASVYSPPETAGAPGDLLILDDAGFAFRHKEMKHWWLLPRASDGSGSPPEDSEAWPKWALLKMSGPVCQGDLWPAISIPFGDRLICVVSADDLRKECVSLSIGLSWERTVEDLRFALFGSPVLKPLLTRPCHLIVAFSADGALWVDNTHRDQPRATLVFDSGGAEGEWAQRFEGEAFGYLSCMMAAVTRAVISNSNAPDFAPAVAAGLAAMRNLREFGHGLVADGDPEGFPNARLARAILKGGSEFSLSRVPWTESEQEPYALTGSSPRTWRIVEMSQSPFPGRRMPSLLGLARQVVLLGRSAIQRLPHARFGDLLTADRLEIETLRTIRRSMLSYKDKLEVKSPLSIGVFGPPGAGKSFGVQQIANDLFTDKAWLPFNLSQFKDSTDLIGAFHQVRDKVLSGVTPVVFWDEFDSKEYDWLQYLLAPMQDGRFQDGQLNHPIGKCVFIFAGGTSHTFEDFGPAEEEKIARRTFELRKGPDFHSRLDAFYDVLGPNRRMLRRTDGSPPSDHRVEDVGDVCAPLRRALLIRALLKVPKDARLDFDAELLDALLRVHCYKHGARSLEKLVLSLQPAPAEEPIRRSALPPITQIAMHVDDDDKRPDLAFDRLLLTNKFFMTSQAIPAIAKAIHQAWQPSATPGNDMDASWDELPEENKEDNIAAARRIPEVLALAGLTVVEGQPLRDDAESPPDAPDIVNRQIKHHLERLAEAEHDGWRAHRTKAGWTYAPERNNKRKKHPSLTSYPELPETEKQKDRDAVSNYQKHLAKAGFHIAFEPAAHDSDAQ